LAALGGFLQEYYPYGMNEQVVTFQIINVVLRLVGGAVLGGALAKFTGDALADTGVLEGMPVAEETASSTA